MNSSIDLGGVDTRPPLDDATIAMDAAPWPDALSSPLGGDDGRWDGPDRSMIGWVALAVAVAVGVGLLGIVGWAVLRSGDDQLTDTASGALSEVDSTSIPAEPEPSVAAPVLAEDETSTEDAGANDEANPNDDVEGTDTSTETTAGSDDDSAGDALVVTTPSSAAPPSTAASSTEATAAPTSSTGAPTTSASTPTSPPTSGASTTAATASPTTPATDPPTTPAPAPSPTPSGDAAAQQEILALTNAERAKAGCPALRLDGTLNAVADSHSEDMAAKGYFDHTSPDGRGPGDRVRDSGYPARGWGENIAQGYPNAAAVVNGWMNSSGHRRNILDCSFNELGVGFANPSSPYWTQVFGTRG